MLRTFVTVADLKSFTRAGEAMGRSQPAVSLQIRRLEEILECQLIDTSGRHIVLTEQGDVLVRFARQLLMLNDEAVARIAGRPSTRRLRVGLPVDYAAHGKDVLRSGTEMQCVWAPSAAFVLPVNSQE